MAFFPETLALKTLIRALNDRDPFAVKSVTSAYLVTRADSIILADATGGAFTVTLVTPVGIKARRYTIKRLNAGANAVTIATASGLIDGAATQALAAQYAKITVVSDGTNWQTV